ncbi:MAG TPA: hypothetical protein DCP92_07735 [Nitrospiraceae bacterium]|nr:hypothetical protein [Nitrospiraceae bacterium]
MKDYSKMNNVETFGNVIIDDSELVIQFGVFCTTPRKGVYFIRAGMRGSNPFAGVKALSGFAAVFHAGDCFETSGNDHRY